MAEARRQHCEAVHRPDTERCLGHDAGVVDRIHPRAPTPAQRWREGGPEVPQPAPRCGDDDLARADRLEEAIERCRAAVRHAYPTRRPLDGAGGMGRSDRQDWREGCPSVSEPACVCCAEYVARACDVSEAVQRHRKAVHLQDTKRGGRDGAVVVDRIHSGAEAAATRC